MAEALGTEPLMVALRTTTAPDPRVTIVPVNTAGIKNDHREYAITWFLLAFVWAVMTGYFLYRSSKDSKKD
jgi:surfeit locus 1 family protein